MLSTKPSRVVIRVIGESFLISLGVVMNSVTFGGGKSKVEKNLKIHNKHDKIVGKERRKLGERQIKR